MARASKPREGREVRGVGDERYLKRTAFHGANKLEIQDDGSFIKVQRPETWNKPWSLGARDLQTMLYDYFRTPGPHTSAACHTYIVNRKKKDMVAKEFAFKRIVNLDDR